MRLVLRGEALRGGLDRLARLLWLLLWLLLGSGTGGTGRGGRRVTLSVRVVALVQYSVFAVPIFERDQYIHIQMGEKLGGGARVWGRKLFREVKQLQDVVPCTRLMGLRETDSW